MAESHGLNGPRKISVGLLSLRWVVVDIFVVLFLEVLRKRWLDFMAETKWEGMVTWESLRGNGKAKVEWTWILTLERQREYRRLVNHESPVINARIDSIISCWPLYFLPIELPISANSLRSSRRLWHMAASWRMAVTCSRVCGPSRMTSKRKSWQAHLDKWQRY